MQVERVHLDLLVAIILNVLNAADVCGFVSLLVHLFYVDACQLSEDGPGVLPLSLAAPAARSSCHALRGAQVSDGRATRLHRAQLILVLTEARRHRLSADAAFLGRVEPRKSRCLHLLAHNSF